MADSFDPHDQTVLEIILTSFRPNPGATRVAGQMAEEMAEHVAVEIVTNVLLLIRAIPRQITVISEEARVKTRVERR